MSKTIRSLSALLAVCFALLLWQPAFTRAAGPDPILAERVSAEELTAGDQVVIVFEDGLKTVSTQAAKTRLAAVSVTLGRTADRTVLTAMDESTAVFEIEAAGGGEVYLKCAEGYLTSAETGNGLFYAAEPEECSKWQFREGSFLYNPAATYTVNGQTYQNYYLEYYDKGDYISSYRKFDNADQAPFVLAFYRLGNSRPEDELVADTQYKLPVFETSDIHGYLADVSGETCQYRLAYISDKVKDARGEGDRAILLDGGDIYQGNPMSNMLQGQSLAAAYQLMGYDAVTIGNHEFDWGIEATVDADGTMLDPAFAEYTEPNLVPVVLSNLVRDGEKVPFAHDYVILDKTAVDAEGRELPVRVAVIGFAESYASSIMYSRFTGLGFSIIKDYEALNQLAADLEASGACDATILLAHMDAEELAPCLGEDTAIDLVLGGHSHTSLCGKTTWGLQYLEPACYGAAYAYSELAFELVDGAPVFQEVAAAETVSVTRDVSKLSNTPENADELDQELVALTDTVLDALADAMGKTIGYITESAQRYVYLPESGERSTTCGNWIASIIKRIAGAEVAFVNNGGLRKDMLVDEESGRLDITLGDVYIMFPFDNRIYSYELTYGELLEAMKYSMTSAGKTVLAQMVGIDCYYVDGAVQALVTADGEAVYVDGSWKPGWEEKTVRVGVSEYLATSTKASDGMTNPFLDWSETERLLSSDQIDNEGAARVLREEAAANGGHLEIDTAAHYINRAYEEPAQSGGLPLVTNGPRPAAGEEKESVETSPENGEAPAFTDVDDDAWYAEAVRFSTQRGLFKGVSESEFAPGAEMSRAMFATVLYRLAAEPAAVGENPFADVEDGKWYSDAVIWAAEKGLLQGYGDGRFGPNDPVTREQMVTILWRCCGSPAAAGEDLGSFSDAVLIHDWANGAFRWAVQAGVVQGKTQMKLAPRDTATRAEVAQVLMNWLRLTER